MSGLFEAMKAGWHQYADGGMYFGVLFVAMLFLWLVCFEKFSKDEKKGKLKLFIYTLGITAVVVFPVTVFLLLKYQTTFFTYSQLFLLVPVLPVIAWALTEFLIWVKKYLLEQKNVPGFVKRKDWVCEAAVVVVLAFVLWMAGSLSFANEVTNQTSNSAKVPENVLQVLQILQTDEDIDLDSDIVVATDEVLEYARAYSADIKLLYGRNMWQKELGAFTYDTYNGDLQKVHEWLNSTVHGLFAVETSITVDRAFKILENSGCTVVVLTTGQFAEEEVKRVLENSNFTAVAETGNYVILKK